MTTTSNSVTARPLEDTLAALNKVKRPHVREDPARPVDAVLAEAREIFCHVVDQAESAGPGFSEASSALQSRILELNSSVPAAEFRERQTATATTGERAPADEPVLFKVTVVASEYKDHKGVPFVPFRDDGWPAEFYQDVIPASLDATDPYLQSVIDECFDR